MRSVIPALVLPVVLLTDPGPSIIRRHDQPDSLYLDLGSRYATLVHMDLPTPQGAGDGEGVLIAPRWVLTAAHVGADLRPGSQVRLQSDRYTVDSIVIHPGWQDGPHDLALIRLGRPAERVRPARLYRESAELGAVLVLVGYGDIGTGLTGPQGNDRRVRGATNRVDEATDFWLKMAFDPPTSARVTPLEGVSGPGDSGGPAYLEAAEGETVAGISSAQSTRAAGGPGRYGVVEYYVRVSRYIRWIETVTGVLETASRSQEGP